MGKNQFGTTKTVSILTSQMDGLASHPRNPHMNPTSFLRALLHEFLNPGPSCRIIPSVQDLPDLGPENDRVLASLDPALYSALSIAAVEPEEIHESLDTAVRLYITTRIRKQPDEDNNADRS